MPGQPLGQPMGQPMPGQPMPGQPYGTPGPAAYGAPMYPMAAPVAQKKSNTGLIVGIVVLVVAILAVVFGFRIFSGGNNNSNGNSNTGTNNTNSGTAGQATTAVAAVQGYLQALAAGNSADALAYMDTTPSDTTYLTDAVLAAGNAINPITNINVTAGSSDYMVAATYTIGSQTINANYYAQQYGKYYKLNNATGSAFLPDTGGMPIKLNGVAVTSSAYSDLTLFPGSYVVTVDNPLLTVTGGNFVVTDPMHGGDNFDMTIDLTADAQTQFQAAAKAQLDSCMAEKAMKTTCGFGFSAFDESGTAIDVDNSSIAWNYGAGSSDDFSSTTFDYSKYNGGLTADASTAIDIELDVKDTSGHPYYQTTTIYTVVVDFSDPTNLAVTFTGF